MRVREPEQGTPHQAVIAELIVAVNAQADRLEALEGELDLEREWADEVTRRLVEAGHDMPGYGLVRTGSRRRT